MQKLWISLLFFTLCCATNSFAQRRTDLPPASDMPLSGTFQSSSPLAQGDTIFGSNSLSLKDLGVWSRKFDSLRINVPDEQTSRHYFSKDGKEYYINIVPAKKGTRVDSSNVWLLRTK